jgi:hypothetical protein
MSFSCSDKDALISYVYGECDEVTRAAVDAHLAACPACADEIAGFGGVRQALVEWAPPERAGGFRLVRDEAVDQPAPAKVLRPARWWQASLPALARVAAAILLFAGGAAIANLEVRYDKDGFMVRTGWRQQAPAQVAARAVPLDQPISMVPAATTRVAPPSPTPAGNEQAPQPWRAELASLERQLRDEFRAQLAAARTTVTAAPVQVSAAADGIDETRVMQRVHALLDESERRQESMIFHVNQVVNQLQSQRKADMARMQQVGYIEVPGPMPQQKRIMENLFPVSLKR